MWLLNLQRTPRLILICVVLGVIGALGVQAFLYLLRRQQVHLDRDILDNELQAVLDRGEGVAIRMHQERIYRVLMPAGSPAAGKEVRSLGLDDIGALIVGVIRREGEIIPNGGTRLQVHDSLLVAATDESIEKFRALVSPPQAGEASGGIVAQPTNDTLQK